MYRIFVVEDDPTISKIICRQLAAWGMEAKAAADFSDIKPEFTAFDPHLVLMDIGLPYYNGFYWCGELRKLSDLPIIFLSSASDKMNLMAAINLGADDFIAKPFDIEVLIAKINAMLRRTYAFGENSRLLQVQGVVLNLSDSSVSAGGQTVSLTKNEFGILKMLFEHRERIVSREELIKALWESESFVDENTLNVNVVRLRQRLASIGVTDFILTRKGQGYCLP
jgi:DNA-binding response OmpR family regulator